MSRLRARLHWAIQRWVLEAGFRLVYPLLARLPARLGLAGARSWGHLMAQLDCDWRNVALREHFVADRTARALEEIAPPCSPDAIKRDVIRRFECACQEELEGQWLAYGLKTELPLRIEGFAGLQDALSGGRGLVLLTFHFDAAIWGIGCLGRAGLRLSPVSSAIVEDERVPTIVRRYFASKYAGLSRYLNGGKVMHHETSTRAFYRRLRQGEGVVIFADDFTLNAQESFITDFFGQQRLFVPGAFRMAAWSSAVVAAFVCLREADGGYRIVVSPPFGQDGDAAGACRAAIAFLEAYVQKYPERWWAADLLLNSIIIN
jgi:hypothetical protein